MGLSVRREIFPVDSFKAMEDGLSVLRRTVMDRAAKIANMDPAAQCTIGDTAIFTVDESHIDRGLVEVTADPKTIEHIKAAVRGESF